MTGSGREWWALCLCVGLIAGPFSRPAAAETSRAYDGRWAVTFVPGQGACAQHRIEVRVSDGTIGHVGDFGLFTASGAVDAQGRVDASIGTLGIAANATGRLSGAEGSGTWTFPDRDCAGRWTAQRLA